MTFRTRAKTIALLAISAVSAVSARSGAPKAVVPVARFEFGEVLSGAVVECDFIVKNEGGAPLVIQRVAMTAPLVVTRMSREVAPGAEGTIHFRLDTANLAGTFRGVIVVFLNDPALPEASLAFEGTVVPAIEVSPLPGFFVAGLRGRGGQKAIEIVNHESEPLQLEKVEHLTERFTTQLETLEPGRRYRLTLHLRPDGPGGKSTGTILLRTSSKTQRATASRNTNPCACLLSEHGSICRTSRSPTTMRPRSLRSAAGWMGSRWRSSWRRRAYGQCRWRKSTGGSISAFAC